MVCRMSLTESVSIDMRRYRFYTACRQPGPVETTAEYDHPLLLTSRQLLGSGSRRLGHIAGGSLPKTDHDKP